MTSVPQISGTFLHRAVRNFLFSGLGTVATFVIGFLFAGLTVRYLGTGRAGFFMALASLTGFNSLLGDFGLGTAAIRRVAELNSQRELSRARKVVGTVSTISSIPVLLIAALILLLFPSVFAWSKLENIHYQDAFWATMFNLAAFVVGTTTNSWRGCYVAIERFDLSSGLSASTALASGLLGIAALILSPTMTAIAVVRFGVTALRAGADGAFLRRILGGVPLPTWAWSEVRPLVRLGGWVYAEGLGAALLGKLNSLVLTTCLGSAALPYYEMPQRFYSQIHGALASQSRFLLPMLAAYGDKSAEKYAGIEDRLRWMVAVGSAVIYGLLALLGVELLTILIGGEFAAAVRIPLYLACLQGFFQAQDIVPYYASYALGVGAPNSVTAILQGGLCAATGLVLIPRLGIMGACLAQMWVIPTLFLHSIWVRRLVDARLPALDWLKVFTSPAVMLLLMIGTASSIRQVLPAGPMSAALAASLGCLLAFAALHLVEGKLLRRNGRWQALTQAAILLIRAVRRRLPVRQGVAAS